MAVVDGLVSIGALSKNKINKSGSKCEHVFSQKYVRVCDLLDMVLFVQISMYMYKLHSGM